MKIIRIGYKPAFLRILKKLPHELQDEAKERIALFAKDHTHPSLRTHKLKGALAAHWSFSVNYQYRIIFIYESKDSIALVAIGDHAIYKQ